MTPSDQRFRADQTAVQQADLRLIEQLELFSFDRKRQFGFQLQPRFKLLPNGVLEYHIAAAPSRLGTTKGQMTVTEQLVRRSPSLRMDGHADSDADAVQPRSRRQRAIERSRNPLAELLDCLGVRTARNGDGKLVAAKARNDALASFGA